MRISSKLIPYIVHFILCILCIIIFWTTSAHEGASVPDVISAMPMTFSLLTFFLILPISVFLTSSFLGSFIGKEEGILEKLIPIIITLLFYGITFILVEYLTFSLANNIAFHKINPPEWQAFLFPMPFALCGLILGLIISFVKRKIVQKKSY